MKKSVASSYDITLARDLSCLLTDRDPSPEAHPYPGDSARYTRFPKGGRIAPVTAPVPAAPAPAAASGPVSAPPAPEKFVTWRDLLTWCMEASRAKTAFVLDADGFVVAHLGEEPVNGFDGMGAELAYAMDFFGRVDEKAGSLGSVNLVFDEKSVYGFRVRITPSVQLVVGIVTTRAIHTELQERIVNTTIVNLSKLT